MLTHCKGTAIISFGGLMTQGCKIKELPESFSQFATDFHILSSLDWFTLLVQLKLHSFSKLNSWENI